MSQICITRAHGLSPKKARQAAEAVASDLQSEYGLQYLWEDDDTLTFQRTGISGQLTLERDFLQDCFHRAGEAIPQIPEYDSKG